MDIIYKHKESWFAFLEYMTDLCGHSKEEVLYALQGLVYKDPESGCYQTADEYLSGNVREKLARAVFAAKQDAVFSENVAALKAVQPKDWEPLARMKAELENARHGLEQPFEHEERLQTLLSRQIELNTALDIGRQDEVYADDREVAAADTAHLEIDDSDPEIDDDEYER